MTAQEQIAKDLTALGLRPADAVLVHSSLRSLGNVPGGPGPVIEGLRLALGAEGTLLLPALSYATVGPAQTTFDVRRTPCCVGAVPEYFRTMPGVLRSVHPTHSVCGIGPRATSMLEGHRLDHTPCGPHSPYRLLRDAGGKILMLGCGLRPNTSMHAVEELVEPPYLLGDPVEYRILLADGNETAMSVRRHVFTGWAQRYDRIEPLLDADSLRRGSVLAAPCYLIDARALWQAAEAALRRDPLFFVEATA